MSASPADEHLPAAEHTCIHHTLQHAPAVVPQRRTPSATRGRRASASDAPALRLVFANETLVGDVRACSRAGQAVSVGKPAQPTDTCSDSVGLTTDCVFVCEEANVLTESKRAFLSDRVLPVVASWFGAALRIRRPVLGPLVVGDASCDLGSGAVNMPARLVTAGSASTDVLIVVTARPIAGATIAFAGHCQQDEGTASPYAPKRPTVGHVNIDPASLEGVDERGSGGGLHEGAVDAVLKVLVHEVFHALGFTHSKLREFPCPDAPGFDRHNVSGHEPRGCPAGRDPVLVRSAPVSRGVHSVSWLVTPKVAEMARRHFNCSAGPAGSGACGEGDECIDGLPLEDCHGGADCSVGSGTRSSHWEKRVLHGELMVGVSHAGQSSSISDMSLALFEDSGWYVADYGVTSPRCLFAREWCADAGATPPEPPREPLLWGRGRGCAFVNGKCSGPAWKAGGYFCEASSGPEREACTVGRLSSGYCTLREHASPILPSSHRYFTDPRLGGRPMEDHCPIVSAYSDWNCREMPRGDAAERAERAAREQGEERSGASRCFTSSLHNGSAISAPYNGCYGHRCLSTTRLQLRVANEWLDCDASGEVRLEGWTGFARCPPAEELCAVAADLGWPEIGLVAPARGPAAGGMPITVSGRQLWDGVEAAPTVLVCGAPAPNVSARGATELVAITPPAPAASGGAALVGELQCHVKVRTRSGFETTAVSAFTYAGQPAPKQCRVDNSNGWDSTAVLTLIVCIWPYVMTAIAAIAGYKLVRSVFGHTRNIRRMKFAARAPGLARRPIDDDDDLRL